MGQNANKPTANLILKKALAWVKKWNKPKVADFPPGRGCLEGRDGALNGLAAPPEGLCPVMLEIKNNRTNSFSEDLKSYSHAFSLSWPVPVEV